MIIAQMVAIRRPNNERIVVMLSFIHTKHPLSYEQNAHPDYHHADYYARERFQRF